MPAQYEVFVNYVIYFADQAEYDFAIAAAGGNGFAMNPSDAAAFFNITPFPSAAGPLGDKGIYGFAPYGIPGPPGPGVEILHPNPSGVFLVNNVNSFIVPGQAGNPASIFPAGPEMLLTWWGNIVKIAGDNGADPELITPIPQRRWLGGVELAPLGEGGSLFNTNAACRDASRTIDGMGLALRGQNTPGPATWERAVNEFNGAFTTKKSWERFYFRLRRVGTLDCGIWRCHGSGSPLAGAALKISTAQNLDLYNISSINAETLIGSFAIVDDEWYLCDILLEYTDGITDGRIRVYLNHELTFDVTVTSGNGLDQNINHASSELGRWTAGTDHQVEIDLDDWMCADIPNRTGVEFLDSFDWLMGSHMRKAYTNSLSQTNWTPLASPEIVNQGHNPDMALNSALVSTTSGAVLEGTTDVVDEQDTIGQVMGPVAAVVGIHSTNSGSTDGTLGYSVAGGAPVDASINQLAAGGYNSVAYRPSGIVVPSSIVPFKVRHTKSADVNTDTTRMIHGVVEYIGTWGLEDDPDTLEVPRLGYLHNCRYPNSMWGYIGSVPDGPVYAVGGTYIGNGTQTTVILPAPCHFLWIRALAGGSNGVKFFGASVGGHRGTTERVVPNYPVRVYMDSAGVVKFVVTGTDVESNANTVTYQYIAFCDPGMRFNLCGAYNRPNGQAGPLANPLQANDFLASAGFVQGEVIGIASSSQGLSYKGPGHTGNTANNVNGTALTNWGTFTIGFLNSLVDIHFSTAAQMNYSLWRTVDPICGYVMCQILSYTGNGAGGNRQIDLTPVSGRFPLFAFVLPHNAAGFYRDPSHAGSNSCNASSLANSTTAITGGGIDFITVGSTLNANGIVYDVFVIPGDSAAWNNGTFFPPNCQPPESPWPQPPYIPPEIAVMGNGGLTLNGQVPLTLLKDVSGIYTMIPGKTNDTLYDRQTGQPNVDVKIPDPNIKTGYLGG